MACERGFCFFSCDLFCHRGDPGKRADTAKIQSLRSYRTGHESLSEEVFYYIFWVHTSGWGKWVRYSDKWEQISVVCGIATSGVKCVSRSEIFLKTCFIAFSLALKTVWSTSFEFMFALITSSRVGHVFQMHAHTSTCSRTHTHTHLIKALGSEGSADIVVPRSLQSPKCQGTYRSIRDNVFLRNMSWPWLTYLRKYSSCAKTDRVSLPVLYSWQHGRSRYGKLAFLLSCV